MQRTSVVLEPTNDTRVRYEDRKGRAKLRSWPSGSIKRKKRSPHSASWGAWVAPRREHTFVNSVNICDVKDHAVSSPAPLNRLGDDDE
jgi:hypothetical protein